jgi:hypothetical protein
MSTLLITEWWRQFSADMMGLPEPFVMLTALNEATGKNLVLAILRCLQLEGMG